MSRHRPALLRGAGRFSRAFREWGEERLAAENAPMVVPELGSLAERAESLGVTLHAGSAARYL